jgi:hypothetical protein
VELGKIFLLFQPCLQSRSQDGNHPFAAPGHYGQPAPPARPPSLPGWRLQTTLNIPRQHLFERCPFQGSFRLNLAEQVIWQVQCRSHKCIFASKHFSVNTRPVAFPVTADGADITGSTTSRQGRRGREELETAEYAEYAEGGHIRSPITNTPEKTSVPSAFICVICGQHRLESLTADGARPP